MRNTIGIAFFVLAFAGHTYADDVDMAPFDPVKGFAPPSVNFDDHNGKGFTWNKMLPCGANRATVTVKFDKAYNSAKGVGLPVAKVWLHAGQAGDPSEQFLAAVVKAPTDAFKLNAQAWLEKATGSSNDGPGYAPADLTHPMQLDFSWTPDGVVTVSFGGEYTKHVSADKPITGIGLGGSWSKFEFVNFKVGRSGPPSLACSGAPSAMLPDSTVTASSPDVLRKRE